MRFEDIKIDRLEIAQSDLDIENRVRTNLFAWNGQFSPQFVEVLLNKYAEAGDTVIDPFLGSGTTIYECARKGLSAIGVELNASAYHISKIYELCNLSSAERFEIIDQIDKMLADTPDIQVLAERAITDKNTPRCNVLMALIVLLDIYYNEPDHCFVLKKWEKLKQTIMELPYSAQPISVLLGDSNSVAFSPDSIDLLITSPPYINVFNYHQKYRRSVELLGYKVLNIARGEIGSNRKNRGNRLLTVIQYCIDMAISLQTASQTCRQNARMIYVVGRESNVLGYSFCNSELIYRIGTEILGLNLINRQERVFKNRYGQMIFEDILHFANTKISINLSEKVLIDAARKIAVDVLREKQCNYPDSENVGYIQNAIDKATSVKKSEANYE